MRSIRTKLILSYIALAMITVIIAGLLSFVLIIRNARIQERDYLNAAARSIAKQVEDFQALMPGISENRPMQMDPRRQHFQNSELYTMMEFNFRKYLQEPPMPLTRISIELQERLQELVDTASFLHNAQVKIISLKDELLAHSKMNQPEYFMFRFSRENGERKGMAEFMNRQFTDLLEESRILKRELEKDTDMDLGEFILLRKDREMPGQMLQFRVPVEHEQYELRRHFPLPLFASGGRQSTITHPIGDSQDPTGYVSIAGGPDFTSRAVITARNALFISSISAIAIALFLGLIMGNRITVPIISLSAAAGRMADGDLDSKVELQSGTVSSRKRDEISILADQFNNMSTKLKESFETIAKERDTLRSFMQDASHHLRTPVTALTTFNELLLSLSSTDRDKTEELLQDSKDQLERLRWIIDKLLHLSRLDSHITQFDIKETALDKVISRAWQTVSYEAQQSGISLTRKIEQEASTCRCDPKWLETALANLFENAIRYSEASTEIKLVIQPVKKGIEIAVNDFGSGIHEDDLPRIFDRFYRAHAQDNRVEGSGLGLAIVKSIVEAHKGTINVESTPGEGSTFTIILPA